MPRRVVLDCDTGTDDAVAIMVAALHPALELLGVCTVFGNLPVAQTTDNTLRVLEYVGAHDVGVYAGAAGPCAPRPVPPDDRMLPPTLPLPAPRGRVRGEAVDFLVETLGEAPATVVVTGPATNLALALRREPALAARLDEVVVLGGSERVPSVTPLAERNVWNDPTALAEVLASGAPVTLVTIDATSGVPLTAADVDVLAALGTPAATAAAELVRERFALYDGDRAPVHDPLAVAWLVDPDVLHPQVSGVRVDLEPGAAYGRTHFVGTGGAPSARVAREADRARFVEVLVGTLGRGAKVDPGTTVEEEQ